MATFDDFLEPLDPPLVVVTATVEGERAGCVVGFHSQCSIEPERYVVWIARSNHTYGPAIRAEHLAVHVLTRSDRALAELFGGETEDEIDKFGRCAWTEGPGGVPLLDDLPRRLVGRRIAIDDRGGDHVAITLAVDDVTAPPASAGASADPPLRASDLADLEPGHPAG